jgi:AraC-like DNA-binding protein
VDALLLELDTAATVGLHEAFVRRVRESFPSLPIVLYAPLTRDAAKQIMRLANAGADELLLEEQDEERHALQRLIIRAHVSRCAARSIGALGHRLPASTRAILTHSIHLADKPLSVEGLARAVGVNRKTLVNRLGAVGLPGPETVISWCRLLLACELLEDRGRSVERVALLLGFGSGVALRNMFRRHLSVAPSALREAGAFDGVVHRLFATSLRRASVPHPDMRLAHPVTAD